MDKVWAIDAIALNFSTELDSTRSTHCSMGFGEMKQFKFLVFGDSKWVIRSFAFIQTNIFLKIKKYIF